MAPLDWLRRLGALTCAGSASWLVFLLADNYIGSDGRLSLAAAALIVDIGLRQSALLIIGCCGLAVLDYLLANRPWVSRGLVAGALLPVCADQALFLTAGDGISSHSYLTLIRFSIGLLLLVFSCVLVEWLRLGLKLSMRTRRARVIWFVFGSAVLIGLTIAIRYGLEFYAHFAALLAFLGAVVALGLPLAWRWNVRRLSIPASIVAGASLLAIATRAAGVERGGLPDSTLASVSRMAVGPHDAITAALDFDAPARFRCRAPADRPRGSIELSADRRKNVILVSVDALRSDMLHWHEGGRPVMPNLSAFAAGALEFRRAVTSYPATIYALGSAFTGYSPSGLLLAARPPPSLLAQVSSRFEQRKVILPKTGWFKMPAIDRLLLQGVEPVRAGNAISQTTKAIRFLKKARKAGAPSFLWVHYYEPHRPYRHHPDLDFGSGKRGAYMSEVALVDRELGRLFAHIEGSKWLEDTLIIIFADHGQLLGENRRFGHHVFLDAAISDIPLIMHYPGVPAGVVPDVVGIADITPTVLEFADLPVPEDIDARSLRHTEDGAGRSVVSESFPVRGRDLFELANDPIVDIKGLRARADSAYDQARRSYDPKVSLVFGEHRLVVNRVTGGEQLWVREGPSRDWRVGSPDTELLVRMRGALNEWHARESERIYCRIVAQQR